MNRSTKTRLLLRDKYKVVHSDRLYRPAHSLLANTHSIVLCDSRASHCDINTLDLEHLSESVV